MSTIIHVFSKYPEEVTGEALKDMLSADINIFFFGLGLLLKAGNLSKLYSENEVSEVKLMFTNWQMIHLMKGTLYFAVIFPKETSVQKKIPYAPSHSFVDFEPFALSDKCFDVFWRQKIQWSLNCVEGNIWMR